MEKLIDISSYPVAQVLDVLLQDKTTKKNIISCSTFNVHRCVFGGSKGSGNMND